MSSHDNPSHMPILSEIQIRREVILLYFKTWACATLSFICIKCYTIKEKPGVPLKAFKIINLESQIKSNNSFQSVLQISNYMY